MKITNEHGERVEAYETLEEAINAYFKGREYKPDEEVSLAVGLDRYGTNWFVVDKPITSHPNNISNCTMDIINDWEFWFLEDWYEKEIDQRLYDVFDFEEEEEEEFEHFKKYLERIWNTIKEEGYIPMEGYGVGGLYLWTLEKLKKEDWFEEALNYSDKELEDENRQQEHDFAVTYKDYPDDTILLEFPGESIVEVISLDDLKEELTK